ncbi:MAG: nicotinate-nucleotide diphosphorylase, partial [bacterium]
MLEINNEIENLIMLSLQEDLSKSGDVTTDLLLDKLKIGQATIIAKQDGIIAGLIVANQVFKKIEKKLSLINLVSDGAKVHATDEIVRISGPIAGILTAERTALNFLQRLSGIATFTSKFVERVKGTKAKILDTRKTTPGLRKLEKYAVRVGSGYNHRMGLYDM